MPTRSGVRPFTGLVIGIDALGNGAFETESAKLAFDVRC
jgi:hypothetical protein